MLNIGVYPNAEVQVAVFDGEGEIVLHLEGERRLEVTIHSEAPNRSGDGYLGRGYGG